jgi:Glycosyl hydrolase family 3 N terminal domain
VEAVSSNIDDKTMHELYLWPFQDAVHAGTGNIMCSYNRVNNSYSCANSKLLNGLLKTELGFQGFVVSDWSAQHAGVATALAGLDMAMPNSPYWAPYLTYAVQNGSVPMSQIDDIATRYVVDGLLIFNCVCLKQTEKHIISINQPFLIVHRRNFIDAMEAFTNVIRGEHSLLIITDIGLKRKYMHTGLLLVYSLGTDFIKDPCRMVPNGSRSELSRAWGWSGSTVDTASPNCQCSGPCIKANAS